MTFIFVFMAHELAKCIQIRLNHVLQNTDLHCKQKAKLTLNGNIFIFFTFNFTNIHVSCRLYANIMFQMFFTF